MLPGGPGSHKGRIVEDLMASYEFKFLSGENIILEEFPKFVDSKKERVSAREWKSFFAVINVFFFIFAITYTFLLYAKTLSLSHSEFSAFL